MVSTVPHDKFSGAVHLSAKFKGAQVDLRRKQSRDVVVSVRLLIFREGSMIEILTKLWVRDDGQDIAEYAVMLAVILVLVVGTIRLVGSNANNAFSSAASSIQ